MASYACKDNILSPECLAYWSRWLEVLQYSLVRFLAIHTSGVKVSLGRKFQILQFFLIKKIEILNQVLIEPT